MPTYIAPGHTLAATKMVYYEDRKSSRTPIIRLFIAGRFDDGAIGKWVVMPYDGLHAINDVAAERSTGAARARRHFLDDSPSGVAAARCVEAE